MLPLPQTWWFTGSCQHLLADTCAHVHLKSLQSQATYMPLINSLGIIPWFWSKVAQHNLTFILATFFPSPLVPRSQKRGWLCSDWWPENALLCAPNAVAVAAGRGKNMQPSCMMEDHTPLPQPAPDSELFITRCSFKAHRMSNTGLLTRRVSVTGQAGACRNYT